MTRRIRVTVTVTPVTVRVYNLSSLVPARLRLSLTRSLDSIESGESRVCVCVCVCVCVGWVGGWGDSICRTMNRRDLGSGRVPVGRAGDCSGPVGGAVVLALGRVDVGKQGYLRSECSDVGKQGAVMWG